MPLVLFWLVSRFGLSVAVVIFACLFVSVLLHEIGHIVAARSLGLGADTILLWPLGGLAFVEPTSNARWDFLVAAAGPVVNLALCAALLPVVAIAGPNWPAVLNPAEVAVSATLAERGFPVVEVCEVAFGINWMLLLANLIPALPLDGGRMMRSWLAGRFPGAQSQDWSIRIAIVAGILLSLVGMLFLKSTVLMGLGFMILLATVFESVQAQLSERHDDSFLGYDFSEGYTSLEKSEPREAPAGSKSVGMVQSWLEQRRETRRHKEELEDQEAEEQLDTLLKKVHHQGLHSLSSAERRLLERVSERYRSRSNRST